VVSAGFEGDENRAAAGATSGLSERVHLGVRASAPGMVSLADDQPIGIENDRSHHWVGGCAAPTPKSEIESVLHPVFVHGVDTTVPTFRTSRFHRERFPAARRLSVPSAADRVFDI
jgi:hypothetical protein